MKLKDVLNQIKYRITPDQDAIRADIVEQVFFEQQRRKKTLLQLIGGGVAALLILTGIGLYSYNYYTFDTSYNITGDIAPLSPIVYVAADKTVNDAAANNTTLSIVTKESMSAKKVSEAISITPEVPFTIKKKGTNRFSLVFDEALENNTSYTVSATNESKTLYRWSLQTEAPFKITNAYPAESQEVDINTTIEVTFSESSVNAFSEFFTIQPKVNGSFKHNGRTWIFLPEEPLAPYTVYTVTVSGNIAGQYEQTIGEDYVFSFTTGASEDKWAYVSNETFDIADTFAGSASPYVTVYANGMSSATADMTVYKLADTTAYLQLHAKYNKNPIVSSSIAQDIADAGLDAHSKFSVSAIPDPENDQLYYFNYPKELEPGYYVTEINWNSVRLYQLLQISDLAVYAAAHDGTYVVWVNSTQTGLPVNNAIVEIGDKSVKTNEKGIATLTPNLEEADGTFITVKADSLLPHIIHAQASTDQTPAAFSDFYSYLYTNSTIYHTTDTVHIWGAVLKRNQSAKSPVVTLYAGWNDTEYPVELDARGTFSIEIPIEEYKLTQSSELSLRVNGYDHYNKYLTVVDYELPTYSLSMQADKNAYFAGETANFNIGASYYNGSPVSNLLLTDNKKVSLTTDEHGNAIHSQVTAVDTEMYEYSLNSCDPQIYWQYIETDATAGDTAFAETPILVFGNNEYLQADIAKDGTRYTLEIKTNKIVTDLVNTLSHSEFLSKYGDLPQKYYLGDAVDKEITLEVHEITYERNKIGSYYDPILKKLQLEYEYIQKDSVIKSDTFSTKDGTATLQDYAIPASEGSRYIKLTMKDAADKECFVTIYIDHVPTEGMDQYEFAGAADTATEGDEIQLNVYNPATKQRLDGAFIYLALGDDHFEADISESGIAEFVFDQKCSPDVTLFGAYFDGTSLRTITPHNISADLADKKIDVAITSDKEQYAPGETVTLDIITTDHDGTPISAALNINVMDKALLTVADNNSAILEELYLSRAPLDIYTSLPIRYYGEGGGDGEPTRSDFEDTPAFISEVTGKDGKASVTFTLPDSLTTWTVSARAVTEDVAAGNTQIEIISTKDLFVTAQVPDTIKVSDDAVISYRCDGAALTADSLLQTTVSLRSEDTIISEQTLETAANMLQYVNLGKLKEGNYTVQIDIGDGTLTDSIQYPINVTNSNITVNAVIDYTDTTEGVTDLILTDSQYGRYCELIDMLLVGGSTRLDHTISEKYAAALAEHFDPKAYKQIDWYFLNNYCIGGGYAPYAANSESDLFLTARIASLFPEEIDREYILWYVDGILSDENATLDNVICALWGKAALHEAVEKDLAYYYADGNVFTLEQQLYFALGYAYSGNQTMATEIYNKHISPKLVRSIDSAYIEDEDQTVMERCNSMLALLTSRISSKDTDDVLNHLLANNPNSTLEIVAYLMEYTPFLEGKNSVRITFGDGSSNVVEYARFAPYTVRISADQANKIKVEPLQGSTIVKTNSTLSGNTIIENGKKLGTIPCFIGTEAKLGDTIPLYLSIDPTKIKGNKLNIVLPAGIRYLKSYTTSKDTAYVVTSEDPDVLTIYFADTTAVDITLQCKAALPGAFVLEPMISVADTDLSYYATDAFPITVTDPSTIPEEGEEAVDGEETTDPLTGETAPQDGADLNDENAPVTETPEQPENEDTTPETTA